MRADFNNNEIQNIAKSILNEHPLCDHCLGRFFAKVKTGMDNKNRGKILREKLKIDNHIKIQNCWLCSGLLDEIKQFTDLIISKLEDYDFETFLIGCKIDEDIIDREKQILQKTSSDYSEPIKNELNREIGKNLEKLLEQKVDFLNPTIMIIIDTAYDSLELQISSLFIYGRYNKFERDIPQTKWFCKICRGAGCKRCNYTGKIYDKSVEELISKTFIEITKAETSVLHGCGREDVDVKMLGNGRPFVLELKNPIKRKINFSDITKKINIENMGAIKVDHLRYSNKDEVSRLKSATFQKKYRAIIQGEKPINNEKLIKATQSLQESKIYQYTPSRVAHRRANMVREKHIYKCQIESLEGSRAIITIIAESGTYIKELITGDDGRTKPNLSEMIDNPCGIIELDVLEVNGE